MVNKIKDAQEQKSEALQNVNVMLLIHLDKDQWNEANQIELGNGAYESEDQGIRNVEDAGTFRSIWTNKRTGDCYLLKL